MRGELIRYFGRETRRGKNIAARNVDFVGQCQCNGIAGSRFGLRPVVCHDFRDLRLTAR